MYKTMIQQKKPPIGQHVSGFTKLSEAMAKYGPEGAEHLAFFLNFYFAQMVKAIAAEGGDIFKFAGDAMIVLWPEGESLETRARHAIQCALTVQTNLHKAELREGVTLSVKIGIGVGKVSVLHLGGILKRMEYVAVGVPLVQAFGAEHHAEAGGEVIVSPAIWSLIKSYVRPLEACGDGYMRITRDGKGVPEGALKAKLPRRNVRALLDAVDGAGAEVEGRLKSYCAGAILPWVSPEEKDLENFGGNLRNVTVLFVNLGLKDHDLLAAAEYRDAMLRAHRTLQEVQQAVYQYEGSVNKFLMDDKGSTLIAVFGLPPLSHEDDAVRGVLSGIGLCDRLWNLGLKASVGITTGVVFCGVVGSNTRKEFTVLGDTVNLSARLMQHSVGTGGGIVVDHSIKRACAGLLDFQALAPIKVKGKTGLIRIYRPYPSETEGLSLETGPAHLPPTAPLIYQNVYEQQLQQYSKKSILAQMRFLVARPQEGEVNPGETEAAEREEMEGGPSQDPNSLAVRGKAGVEMVPMQFEVCRLGVLQPVSDKQVGSLLRRAPPAYTPATLPPITQIVVKVASRFKDASKGGVDGPLPNYTALEQLPAPLVVDDEASSLLKLRDYAVRACMDAGLLVRAAKSNAAAAGDASGAGAAGGATGGAARPIASEEFVLLMEHGTQRVVVPALDIPTVWLQVLAMETEIIGAGGSSLGGSGGAGTLEVKLVRARDVNAVVPKHLGAIGRLITAKVALCSKRQGSCVIVEGGFGTGKTTILRKFALQTMQHRTSVFVGTANPFERMNPYGVWGQILTRYVDQLADFYSKAKRRSTVKGSMASKAGAEDAAKQGDAAAAAAKEEKAARRQLLLEAIRPHLPSEDLLKYVALLGPLTGTSIYPSEELKALRVAANPSGKNPNPLASSTTPITKQKAATGPSSGAGADGSGKEQLAVRTSAEPSRAVLVQAAAAVEVTPEQAKEAIYEATQQLIMAVVRSICAKHPAVIMLDGCQQMTEPAWSVARRLAQAACAPANSPGAVQCLFCIGTRPWELYTDIIFQKPPPSYVELMEAPSVQVCRLDRISYTDVRALIAYVCNWNGPMEATLSDLIDARCLGNPLQTAELALQLVAKGLVGVIPPSAAGAAGRAPAPGESGTALIPAVGKRDLTNAISAAKSKGRDVKVLMKGVLALKDGVETSIPYCVMTSQACSAVVDRRTTLQQLVLMVGALISHTSKGEAAKSGKAPVSKSMSRMSISEHAQSMTRSAGGITAAAGGGSARSMLASRQSHSFNESYLMDCFPFKSYMEDVIRTCEELTQLGLLHTRKVAAIAGSKAPPEVVYTFATPALADTVRLRMLQKRRKELVKAVQRAIEQRADFAKRAYMGKMMKPGGPGGGPVSGAGAAFGKSGSLLVRKNIEAKGKSVFGFSSPWKNRHVVLTKTRLTMYRSDGGEEVGEVDLKGSSATDVNRNDEITQDFCFRVDCRTWSKKGQAMASGRAFYLAAASSSEAQEWVYFINFAADRIKLEEAQKLKAAGGAGGGKRRRGPVDSDSDSDEDEDEDDMSPEDRMRVVFPPDNRVEIFVGAGRDLPPATAAGLAAPYIEVSVVAPAPAQGLPGGRSIPELPPATGSLGVPMSPRSPGRAARSLTSSSSMDLESSAAAAAARHSSSPSAHGEASPVVHSRVLPSTRQPDWGKERVVVPLSPDLAAAGYVVLRVKDRNRQHADETLGAAVIPLTDLEPIPRDPAQVQTELKKEAAKRAAEEKEARDKAEADGSVTFGSGSRDPMRRRHWLDLVDTKEAPSDAKKDRLQLRVPAAVLLDLAKQAGWHLPPGVLGCMGGVPAADLSEEEAKAAVTFAAEATQAAQEAASGGKKKGASGRELSLPLRQQCAWACGTLAVWLRLVVTPSVAEALAARRAEAAAAIKSRRDAYGAIQAAGALADSGITRLLLPGWVNRSGEMVPLGGSPALDEAHVALGLGLARRILDAASSGLVGPGGDGDMDGSGYVGAMMLSNGRRKSGISLHSATSGSDRMGMFPAVAEGGAVSLSPGVSLSAAGANAALERLEAALQLLGAHGAGAADPAAQAMAPAALKEMLSSAAVTLRQSLRAQRGELEDGSATGLTNGGGGAGNGSGNDELLALTDAMEVDETNRRWLMDSYGGGSSGAAGGGASSSRLTSARSETGVLALAPAFRKGVQARGGTRRHSALPASAGILRFGGAKGAAKASGAFTPPGKTSSGGILRGAVAGQVGGPEDAGSIKTDTTEESGGLDGSVPVERRDFSRVPHGDRCALEPGYLLRGRPLGEAAASGGRYGWGVSWLGLPEEDSEPAPEGEAAGPADRIGRGGWPMDGAERVNYDSAEGDVYGPFRAMDVWDWYSEDFLPAETDVRCGDWEGQPEQELQEVIDAVFLRNHASKMRCAIRGKVLAAIEAAKAADEGEEAEEARDGEDPHSTEYDEEDEGGGLEPSHDPRSWLFDFEALGLRRANDMLPVGVFSFLLTRLPRFVPVSENSFVAFLTQVHRGMTKTGLKEAPYHSLQHITDVTHAATVMMLKWRGAALLTADECMGLFCAALCHDLEHPGRTNAFYVATESELAVLYNDQAVLENHHAARASSIMSESDLLDLLPRNRRLSVRRLVVQGILATDMGHHFELVNKLRNLGESQGTAIQALLELPEADMHAAAGPRPGAAVDPGTAFSKYTGILPGDGAAASIDNVPVVEGTGSSATSPAGTPMLGPSDRLVVLKTILHACDISNPTRSWRASKRWSDRLLREFFAQGDLEKRLELPVSANMDREQTDQNKMSLNFIDFIVAPLYVAAAAILPGASEACDMLNSNRRKWEVRMEAEAKAKGEGAEGNGAPQKPGAGAGNGGAGAGQKAAWKRRSTAFHQVLMPMVHRMRVQSTGDASSSPGGAGQGGVDDAAGSGEEAEDSSRRVMALNALSTFAAAASGELAPVGEEESAADPGGEAAGEAEEDEEEEEDMTTSGLASDDEEMLGWGSKQTTPEGSVV